LSWWLNETNLSFLTKFLSSDLTKITITTDAFVGPGETVEPWDEELPDEVVPTMRSAIKMFPSSLQFLRIQLGVGPQTYLTEEISTFILGCGETLRIFCTNLVLSTQAIVHLMKLPNLRAWVTEQGPPQVTDLIRHGIPDGPISLFPSLKELNLRGEEALEWLSLFEDAKSRTPPWIMAGDSLPILVHHHPTLPINSSLISRLIPLANLADVKIEMGCLFRPCVSQITDQDVERLAIALPKLEALSLGEWPCGADTCLTTIRSLLFFSIHCPKLRYLSIHFRMANLRADMLDLLGYAYSQGLHSRPKCVLGALVTGEMYTKLSDYDPGLISMGMLMIFPSLTKFVTRSPTWTQLEVLVKALGQVGGVVTVTEGLMECLNGVRESVENGVVPVRSAVSFCLSFGLSGGRGWACLFIDVTLRSLPQDEIARIFCKPLSLTLGAD
jgi:hypothetical protein